MMTKFVSIKNLDAIDEDFIIEDPEWIDFECTVDQTPKVKMIVSVDIKEIENLQRFHNIYDCNLRMPSIKVKSRNLFRYYWEFYDCTELDIHPLVDIEHYQIKFKCIHFDVMKKDNGVKIRKFEPFTPN